MMEKTNPYRIQWQSISKGDFKRMLSSGNLLWVFDDSLSVSVLLEWQLYLKSS